MRQISLVVGLVGMLAGCAGSAGGREPRTATGARCDESTPEGIAAALKDAGREPPSGQYKCEPRRTSVPNLVVVGSFAYDFGCRNEAVLVDCALRDPEADARDVLLRLGWASGDRATLARAYATEVMQEPAYVLQQAPPEFARGNHSAFAPPTATVHADGGVEVAFWTHARPSNRPQGSPTFYRYVVTFSPDGTPQSPAVKESF